MDKSPDAFRTISEVAEGLEIPAHVLRFWESRFPQIRPVKRAGGRRYYRPSDVALLTGIKHLLHDEGMTIRGVQKILREQGVRHVAALSGHAPADEADDAEAALEAALAENFGLGKTAEVADTAPDTIESAQVVALEDALRQRDDAGRAPALPTEAQAALAEILPLFDFLPEQTAPAPQPAAAAPAVAAAPPLAELRPQYAQDYTEDAPEAAHWLDPELDDTPLAAVAISGETAASADAPLLARIRALNAGALAGHAHAAALRDRLADLARRMASPLNQAPH
jgi:DNA-binding transcriptional MerR regulator